MIVKANPRQNTARGAYFVSLAGSCVWGFLAGSWHGTDAVIAAGVAHILVGFALVFHELASWRSL